MRRNVPKIASAAACKAVFAEIAAHKFFRPLRTTRSARTAPDCPAHRIFQPPAGSIVNRPTADKIQPAARLQIYRTDLQKVHIIYELRAGSQYGISAEEASRPRL